MLSVYTGWNGGYISYGVGLDFWLMKLKIGFYGVEAGSSFKEKESERIVLALTLLDMHFDLQSPFIKLVIFSQAILNGSFSITSESLAVLGIPNA